MPKLKQFFNLQFTLPILALLLMILEQVFVLSQFSFKITDSDQTILWLAASDMANGLFYTPYFYGQSYNMMLEAIIGAGFIKAGLAVKYAVPLAANLLAFIPWLVAIVIATKLKSKTLILIISMIYMSMPIEYHLISVMARGFMGGIATFSLGVGLIVKQSNKTLLCLGFFLSFCAILINLNFAIIGLPLGLYLLLEKRKSLKQFFIPFFAAVVFFIIINFRLIQFNNSHPTYNLHCFWKIQFGFQYFEKAIHESYYLFKGIFPFLFEIGIGLFPLLLILGLFIQNIN